MNDLKDNRTKLMLDILLSTFVKGQVLFMYRQSVETLQNHQYQFYIQVRLDNKKGIFSYFSNKTYMLY